MAHLRLLSTDFDGTLIEHPSDGKCSEAFADVLVRHRADGGLWAVNTGRGLPHAIEGVEIFSAPIEPDFLLTNEREIFHRNGAGGWVADWNWNEACRLRHEELFARAGEIFRKVGELASDSPDVTVIEEGGQPVGLVTTSEQVMQEVSDFLDREAGHLPEFHYQRNTVYLRFCHRDYHKGAALGELCRTQGIGRSEVLAAGDHFNDLSMLDGRFAAFSCCPSNAIEPVKTVVRQAGGYVASRPAANGVAEAWKHFAEGL